MPVGPTVGALAARIEDSEQWYDEQRETDSY